MLTQGATNTFKVGLATGAFDFAVQSFKIALFTGNANLGPDTAAYSSGMPGEVVAPGYTAGGQFLTVTQVPTIGNQTGSTAAAYWSFANVTWNASLTARGALIYLATGGQTSVCVLDFGSDKTSTTTFTVQFPISAPTTAILRIA